MKNVNRRRFLKTSLVGAALATAGQSALANKLVPRLNKGNGTKQKQSNKTEVDLKISFQEGTARATPFEISSILWKSMV